MKHTLCFSILFLCLILTKVSFAQSHEQCIHCSMAVKNLQFKAQAQTQSGKLIWFDAIECLVNYLKSKNENDFQKIQVTDYNSGKVIDAANAYYLKSKAIPSPMGANLSAYMLQSEAISVQKEKGGDVYNWETLKERFIDLVHGALGFNFLLAGSKLILGVEIGIPLYQNYNGIFMNEKFGFNGSAKYNVF